MLLHKTVCVHPPCTAHSLPFLAVQKLTLRRVRYLLAPLTVPKLSPHTHVHNDDKRPPHRLLSVASYRWCTGVMTHRGICLRRNRCQSSFPACTCLLHAVPFWLSRTHNDGMSARQGGRRLNETTTHSTATVGRFVSAGVLQLLRQSVCPAENTAS